jgi:hypothetical protein
VRRPVIAAVAILATAAAGCASSAPPVTSSAAHVATATARQEVDRLLRLVRTPPDARRLPGRPAIEDGPGFSVPSGALVSRVQWWRVPMPMTAAGQWLRRHPPTGLRPDGSATTATPGRPNGLTWAYADRSTPTFTGASLQIGVVPAGDRASFWAADALAQPLDPRPLRDDQRGPRIHLAPGDACPDSRTRNTDVRTEDRRAATRLLPDGRVVSALLCRYAGLDRRPPFALTRSRRLGGPDAARLASDVRRLPLAHVDGAVAFCPMDRDTAVLLAFGYADGRSADLMYFDSGCSYAANGVIRTAGLSAGFLRDLPDGLIPPGGP